MAPKKRKASAPSAPASSSKKKAKADEPAEPEAPAPAPKSSSKSKPLGSKTVSEVWATVHYVSEGKMTQEGFSSFIGELGIEEMSFEAIYLIFKLAPNSQAVDDVMIVCAAKQSMQSAMDSLGCRTMADVPAKLRAKRGSMEADFGPSFAPFFRWLFEMGKAIAALNNNVQSGAVRTVPLSEGLALMEAVLGAWPLMGKLKAFCVDKYNQPFSKDLWTQIGRFVHMSKTGRIRADLSNYDDDDAGGSAWPCAIDEFVEFVQAESEQ